MKKTKEKLKARLAAVIAVVMLLGFSPGGPSVLSAFAAGSEYVFKVLVEPRYTFYSVYEFHAGMAPVQDDVYKYWYYSLEKQSTVGSGGNYSYTGPHDPVSGLAKVVTYAPDGKTSTTTFIDKAGAVRTIALPAGYENYTLSYEGFKEGLLRISALQSYAFITSDGKVAPGLSKEELDKYDYVGDFFDGYAYVYTYVSTPRIDGYIDKSGNFYDDKPLVAPKFPNDLEYFKEYDRALGYYKQSAFKDADGNDIPLPKGYSGAYFYHDGYAWVMKGDKWGIVELREAYDVTISPSAVTLQKGTNFQFGVRVAGKDNPTQAVEWSVIGGSAGTSISTTSGALTIAAGETAGTLTVEALSLADKASFGTATVTVSDDPQPQATVSSVEVYPPLVEMKRGESFQFSAWVHGANTPTQAVTWSVEGGNAATAITTSGGALTIAENETATTLTVRATSVLGPDPKKSGTAKVEIVTPSSPVTGGGGGGGGGIQTVPAADDGAVRLSFTQSGGNVTLVLPDDKVNDIIKNSTTVATVDLSKVTNATAAVLPKAALEKFAAAGLAVEFKLPQGAVTLDAEAVKSAAAQAGGSNVSVALKSVAQSELNARQRTAVGEARVYDISVSSDGKYITSFDGGRVTIALPYTLKAGEKASGVAVWYLDGEGNIQKMDVVYDASAAAAIFTADHLSLYAVGYDPAWENPFSDVKESDWFYGDVEFVHVNGLFSGTSATTFAPNARMTRGMLVTVLGRLHGAETGARSAISFSDVAADKYYADYVAWAKDAGIVDGTGGGKFAPDAEISRQDMAVILSRYVDFAKKNFPVTLQYSIFADESAIADYAKNAVQTMYSGGILNGKPENKFDP
ncbi:MAG: S-layer homology domain-containing protein, partial [Clostridiales Family XIII bacterium]|nr:S-layer homology domain-containing protein [Clostridiales Family XIII bacterium]